MYSIIKTFVMNQKYDLVHDIYHTARVLFNALKIAEDYHVNYDILIAACLLHDIGRSEKYREEDTPHEVSGTRISIEYLIGLGWDPGTARIVGECIRTHSFQRENIPQTLEAKILHDADKIELTGSIGIARSLMFQREIEEPLYVTDTDNRLILDCSSSSFLDTYQKIIKDACKKMYTPTGKKLILMYAKHAEAFYHDLLKEISFAHNNSVLLEKVLTDIPKKPFSTPPPLPAMY